MDAGHRLAVPGPRSAWPSRARAPPGRPESAYRHCVPASRRGTVPRGTAAHTPGRGDVRWSRARSPGRPFDKVRSKPCRTALPIPLRTCPAGRRLRAGDDDTAEPRRQETP
ncbi:hypothetical protein SSP531S_38790 [Streptomyces spongiicola]|uniref:Uncharacterized protein n=1 Tax=Streptomyces spongiicola TaxID=1690221 RepID=A0A388T355_9ACTN|nr:hypothetical protein SSP531S_38790 [Streptomyces spongiicola]